jgi:hypothetical protein
VVTELQFVPGTPENVVAFTITTEKECIFVAYNANEQPVDVEIPVEGAFQVYVEGRHAGTDVRGSVAKQARVEAVSCLAAVTSL